MRFLLNNLVLAAGVVVLLTCFTTTAQAGFIVPADAFVQGESLLSATGAHAPLHNERPVPPPQTPAELFQLSLLGHGPSGQTTGMGTGFTNTTSDAGAAAVVDVDEVSSGQLTAYLLGEPSLLLPTPFLDGVFRPPQS